MCVFSCVFSGRGSSTSPMDPHDEDDVPVHRDAPAAFRHVVPAAAGLDGAAGRGQAIRPVPHRPAAPREPPAPRQPALAASRRRELESDSDAGLYEGTHLFARPAVRACVYL